MTREILLPEGFKVRTQSKNMAVIYTTSHKKLADLDCLFDIGLMITHTDYRESPVPKWPFQKPEWRTFFLIRAIKQVDSILKETP